MMDMGMNAELERDGGSEGEALSTEGSSAGSMYCSLEQDFNRIMTEMKTNENLAAYEAEYTRVFEALYKSNQQNVELEKKLSDLKEEMLGSVRVITELQAQTRTDSTNIEKLSAELLEFKQLADVTHTREQRAQEVIGNLRISIQKLTEELELKNKQLVADETVSAQKQTDASKDKDVLLQEIETMKHRMKTLTAYNTEIDEKLNASEATVTELTEKINKLDNELTKERRVRDQCETELQAFLDERRHKMFELQTVEETLKTTTINYKKQEVLLKEQIVETERQIKETKRLQLKILNLKSEHSKIAAKNDNLKKEVYKKANTIKEMTKEMNKRKEEIAKVKSEKDHAIKGMMREQSHSLKMKLDMEQAQTNLSRAEREIEHLKKALESDKKSIEKLNRDKEVMFKANANLEDLNKKYVTEINLLDQSNRKLETSLEEMTNNLNEAKRQSKHVEKERDRILVESRDLYQKVEDYMEEVKRLRLEIADYQKRLVEADARYRQQLTLFEEVRSERNLYKKNFSLAQEEVAELKNKFKGISVANTKLEEQLVSKTDELLKQEFLFNKLEKEKDNIQTELMNCQKKVSNLNHELAEMSQKEKRLNQAIRDSDLTINRHKKEIESMINERDIIGTQIVRRNDEMSHQYNKIQLLSKTLSIGEKQYNQRLQEIRMLKLEIKKLRMEKAALLKNTKNLHDLRGEIFNLERNLTKERIKVVALEEEIQNPLNIHRWRNLEGTDPDGFELLTKINFLQKRILKMSSEMVAKEKKIKDTEKLYMNLREIISKQPGPEVLVTLCKTRKALRERGKKMKCLVAELNMTLKTEHKFEMEKVKKELNDYKAKYFAQKKKNSKPCEPKRMVRPQNYLPPCNPEMEVIKEAPVESEDKKIEPEDSCKSIKETK